MFELMGAGARSQCSWLPGRGPQRGSRPSKPGRTHSASRLGQREREAFGTSLRQEAQRLLRPGLWTEPPGPGSAQRCRARAWPTSAAGSGGGRMGVAGGLAALWREQQLDELLELLPVLVDVDLGLPKGVDQHRVTDFVQHDVCPQLGVQSVQVKEWSPQDSWPGWGTSATTWERGSPCQGRAGKVARSGQAEKWGWGPGPAEPSPEVLDADHLAPGPGPVHGPPIRICALARSSLCKYPAHATPTVPTWGAPGSSLAQPLISSDFRQVPFPGRQ